MSSHRGDTGCCSRGECWWVGRVGTRTTWTNLPNRRIQSSFLPNLLSRRDVDRALCEARKVVRTRLDGRRTCLAALTMCGPASPAASSGTLNTCRNRMPDNGNTVKPSMAGLDSILPSRLVV